MIVSNFERLAQIVMDEWTRSSCMGDYEDFLSFVPSENIFI
jgi:hypothetical protein